ncbi:MAG: LacI family DNA-binding transcriptional regulator [Devosia nanyangense]|uniref:LacI family DNA-binding transcriptional regulator n=1 Tax=Devosia nanyangense TaxID=1228055 RepID=A0A933NXE5_9HYPH|nr:LacI family DNA-binding transcriptional regulator [Devosia nanyangense]
MKHDAAPGKITIADVARLAGVSKAVASRALSPEPRPVSADKRERVLAAAAELGFRVNLLAQSLTTKTVNLVAVVVNHIHDLSDLDLFDLLIAETQATGKQVILLRVGSVAKVEEFLRQGVAYHVDAALVFSDFADAATVRQMFRTNHVIMLNGRHDRLSPAIMPDEAQGIGEAVADAAAHGVTAAALVTGRSTSLVEQARIASYRKAFKRHGITLTKSIQGDYSYLSGHAAAAEFGEGNFPGAIFCTSDAMAMGILDVHRMQFPGDRPGRFRLYGFDNLSLLDFDAYPIASIGYDKSTFVSETVRMISHPESFEAGRPPVLIPTHFIPRATAS